MSVPSQAATHLLKVCDGILAGVYGVQLDEETHKQLLTDLREAVEKAKEPQSDLDKLTEMLAGMPADERSRLLAAK